MPRRIDCTYIPVIDNSKCPATPVQKILKYSDRLIILSSNNFPIWCHQYSHKRVSLVRLTELDGFQAISNLSINRNPSTQLRPEFDTGIKRTLALLHAKARNYRNVLLLDDDIVLTEYQISHTGSVLTIDNVCVAGFYVRGFADISTTRHIEHYIHPSRPINITMTGSALFVDPQLVDPIFPQIYNDDLFFFLRQQDHANVVSVGYSWQRPRTPWIDLSRISHEQYGDLIYETVLRHINAPETDSNINWQEEIEAEVDYLLALRRQIRNPNILRALGIAIKAVNNFSPNTLQETYDELGLIL